MFWEENKSLFELLGCRPFLETEASGSSPLSIFFEPLKANCARYICYRKEPVSSFAFNIQHSKSYDTLFNVC